MRTAVVVIGLFAISPAYASDITLFGGFQHQGEISRSIGPFPPCSTVNPPGAPGVRCSVSPSGVFATTTFESARFGVFGLRLAHGGAMFGLEHTLAFSPDMSIYSSNLMVQTRGARIKPYATAGLGGVFTSKEDLPNPASVPIDMDVSVSGGSRAFGNNFALNYGGGVKVFTTPRLGARLDVRGYTVPNIQDPRQDQTLHLFEMSIGIVFSISK
jgi:hypothetical protein